MMKKRVYLTKGSQQGLPGMIFQKIGSAQNAASVKKILKW